jgi:hypothetical protein
MSGVGRHRPENARLGAGRSVSDYTRLAFPPEGLGLDYKGPQAPIRKKESAFGCPIVFARGIVTRRAETDVPRLRGNRLAR